MLICSNKLPPTRATASDAGLGESRNGSGTHWAARSLPFCHYYILAPRDVSGPRTWCLAHRSQKDWATSLRVAQSLSAPEEGQTMREPRSLEFRLREKARRRESPGASGSGPGGQHSGESATDLVLTGPGPLLCSRCNYHSFARHRVRQATHGV